jgi:Zn-dependent protease
MLAIIEVLVSLIALAVTITIHESAHAWMADKLGDPTARLSGRLSLNPLKHYDPIGTTLLLVLAVMSFLGLPVIPFGWAKPVPFDPYNLKDPRKGAALISVAGPSANIIFAIFLALIVRIFPMTTGILALVIILNLSLAIFNLIPIHPLDGGKILAGFLPEKEAREFDYFMNRVGIILLIFLIFPIFGSTSLITSIFYPIINFLLNLLIPGFGKI